MASPIVFLDIAGPSHELLRSFYLAVLGDSSIKAVRSRFRSPRHSKALYARIRRSSAFTLGFPISALIEAAGGTIDEPRFEVSGVVVIGLFKNPAGDPMGLVEMDGG